MYKLNMCVMSQAQRAVRSPVERADSSQRWNRWCNAVLPRESGGCWGGRLLHHWISVYSTHTTAEEGTHTVKVVQRHSWSSQITAEVSCVALLHTFGHFVLCIADCQTLPDIRHPLQLLCQSGQCVILPQIVSQLCKMFVWYDGFFFLDCFCAFFVSFE